MKRMFNYDNTVQTAGGTFPTADISAVPARRVGTFTMGAALVILGISLLISLINGAFPIDLVAKLSPAILVFLGIEILIENFLHRSGKIRYDFLSGVVCFLLICGSLAIYSVPYAISVYGPERSRLEMRLEDKILDTCYEALASEDILSLQASVHLYSENYTKDFSIEEIKGNGKIYASLTLPRRYTTAAEFSESCKAITDKLLSTGLPFDQISFDEKNADGLQSFSMVLDDRFQYNMTSQEMEAFVRKF